MIDTTMPNSIFVDETATRCQSVGVLLQNKPLICGGLIYGHFNGKTKLVTLNQPPCPRLDLPFCIIGHSMVKVDNKTIYIIGGMIGKTIFQPRPQPVS